MGGLGAGVALGIPGCPGGGFAGFGGAGAGFLTAERESKRKRHG